MILSNFGIWNFDNLIFLDIENLNFWIYMFVTLVFLLCVCVGGGVLNLLCQKRRMNCTWSAEPSLPETKNELHLRAEHASFIVV